MILHKNILSILPLHNTNVLHKILLMKYCLLSIQRSKDLTFGTNKVQNPESSDGVVVPETQEIRKT